MAGFAFLDRISLSPRERRLAMILGGVLAAILLVGVPIGIEFWVRTRRDAYEEMRTTLSSVQNARTAVRERQAKKEAISQRYQKRAPALAGFLEQAAREQKLQVVDAVDRPEAPHGKRYVERNTVIHFKKVGMLALGNFLQTLETSGNAIAVTRLDVRKRTGDPDQYDVEVGVSAYDRNESTKDEPAKKDEKAP
jgi:general secretion pathway protein M